MNFFDELNSEPLTYKQSNQTLIKNIDDIQLGASQDENYLYFRSAEQITVYDRICDHNGGRLSLREAKATCPLHGWTLDLSCGKYTNAGCSKEPIMVIHEYELDSPLISIPLIKSRLRGADFSTEKQFSIRFINHACLVFESDEVTFATDPWLIGSAFSNGWWLAKETPEDAFDSLNRCDFIYISHNHPDHLHAETLSHIRKDMPILTAGFKTESTKKLLQNLGFEIIHTMDFVSALVWEEKELFMTVLKSGDFRDDSGLFFQYGNFRCLLTVDSNYLDFGRFPESDLLCSSFAGGASGFPLCFDNYSNDQKKEVVARNCAAIRATNGMNMRATNARYFLPYAGFFSEMAERDYSIRASNEKNTISDFERMCQMYGTELLSIDEFQCFTFRGRKLIGKSIDKTPKLESSYLSAELDYDDETTNKSLSSCVLRYFSSCEFKDNLLVDLIPTDANFGAFESVYQLDFSERRYTHYQSSVVDPTGKKQALDRGLRYLQIKVRKAELLDVIRHGKPWEDLSIGFQCRIYREPNIYNSEFWFYFTNVYIGETALASLV